MLLAPRDSNKPIVSSLYLGADGNSTSDIHAMAATVSSVARHSSRLQDLLNSQCQNLVGAAIAVVDTDNNIEFATIGTSNVDEKDSSVTADTPFPLWSTTKLLTATLVCQLVDEGAFTLDDMVTKLLPESLPMFPAGQPTIRQLLSHSAGLVDIFESIDEPSSLIAKVVEHGPTAAPGEIISYTNTAYVLLSILLTKLTGQDWPTLVRSRILEPLGLRKVQLGDEVASGVVPAAKDHEFALDGSAFTKELFARNFDLMAAAGSTAAAPIVEAATLMSAILFGTGPGLLSAAMRSAMQTKVVSMPGSSTFCEGWGAGWAILDERLGLVGHMGAVASYVMGSAKLGKIAVFLSNTPSMSSRKEPGALVGKPLLYEALGIPPRTTMLPKRTSNLQLPLRVLGKYSSPLFSFEIVQKEDHLEALSILSPEPVVLEQTNPLEFQGKVGTMSTEFNFIAADSISPPSFLHTALRAIKRV